jgi:hypothetical protein
MGEPEVLETEAEFTAALKDHFVKKTGKAIIPHLHSKITDAHRFWQEVMAFGGFDVVRALLWVM